jgi:hypothetical protein
MYKDSVTIIKPVANGPSARELRREIGFYMQTKRSFLKKVTLIVCFLDSKRKGSEVQLIFIENQNKN